jgi:hypothetical protein
LLGASISAITTFGLNAHPSLLEGGLDIFGGERTNMGFSIHSEEAILIHGCPIFSKPLVTLLANQFLEWRENNHVESLIDMGAMWDVA